MMPKRIYDIVLSFLALLLLLPFIPIIALLVKLSSPGPVFFIQRRIGRNMKPFSLIKFRTMVVDAAERGPSFTTERDPRKTSIGRLLRKAKIDELPQLINVLKGDMSLVGPRPEAETYVNMFRKDFEEILRIRPGITDIASLTYRNEEEVLEGKKDPEEYYISVLLPEKIKLAKEYARKASTSYDVKLMILTVFSILYPRENILRLIDRIAPYRKPIVIGLQVFIFVLANYLAFFIRFDGEIPGMFRDLFLKFMPFFVLIRTIFLFAFSLDKGLWRYVSVKDLVNITAATSFGSLLFLVTIRYVMGIEAYPRSVYVIDWFLNIFLLGGIRMLRRLHEKGNNRASSKKKIVIIGAGDAAEMLLRDVEHSAFYSYQVAGLIDDNPAKRGLKIRNIPILGTRKDLPSVIREERPDEFLIAIPTATREEFEHIVKEIRQYGLPIKTVPSLWSILSGRDSLTSIKMIEPEDILFRAPVYEEGKELKSHFEGKTVMVTGAGGSIGSEISRQLALCKLKNLVLFERHEENLYKVDLELRSLKSVQAASINAVIGDILDTSRLDQIMMMFQPDIVLHAAAYKHVPLMEDNPYEAFKTNILGTKMMIEKAHQYNVGRFVLISTDKAVNPVNVMGMTKKIAEDIVKTFAHRSTSESSTKFVIVRFGNVLESSGSVVPLFNEQIRKGGPVTVTHAEMIRYFMTIPEAVSLVLQAALMGSGGEVFVLDMGEPVKILDLAKRLISLYGYSPGIDIDISFIGLRPGEKLYEELFNSHERIEKTSHPKINKAIAASQAKKEIEDLLNGIIPQLQDSDGIKTFLAKLSS